LSVKKFIFEFGCGIKAGQALMADMRLSREYPYQILTLPTLQILTKYRFQYGDLDEERVKVASAFHAGIVFDKKKLSIVDNPIDPINGVVTVNDVKFQIGMGFYF
jgi:hypothetical protein